MWGKLASEILVQNWETALEDVNKLREYIDSNIIGNSVQVLQLRTWLIHWSLFVFFNHVKGRDLIIEMFLYRPQYVSRINYIPFLIITSLYITFLQLSECYTNNVPTYITLLGCSGDCQPFSTFYIKRSRKSDTAGQFKFLRKCCFLLAHLYYILLQFRNLTRTGILLPNFWNTYMLILILMEQDRNCDSVKPLYSMISSLLHC